MLLPEAQGPLSMTKFGQSIRLYVSSTSCFDFMPSMYVALAGDIEEAFLMVMSRWSQSLSPESSFLLNHHTDTCHEVDPAHLEE